MTTSPSMDILISSNLERLIYRIAGNDADKNRELMSALSGNGKYEITEEMKAQLADFYGTLQAKRRPPQRSAVCRKMRLCHRYPYRSSFRSVRQVCG